MAVQFLGATPGDIGRTMALMSSPFTSMPSMALTDNLSKSSKIVVPLGLMSSYYTLAE